MGALLQVHSSHANRVPASVSLLGLICCESCRWFQSAGNCSALSLVLIFSQSFFSGLEQKRIFISIMYLVSHLLLNFLSSLFPLDIVLSFLLLVVFHSPFHSPRVKYALSFIFLTKFLISHDPLEVVTIRILCDA